MPEYVAFLRAVNVAGHARASMDDVRCAFEAAGCRNVRTLLQSGNVIFDARAADLGTLLVRARGRLRTVLGEDARIFVRSSRAIARLFDEEPFAGLPSRTDTKLYVAFLAGLPRRRPALPITDRQERLEAVAIRGREAFIVSRRKASGMFGFPNNFIERALGVMATTRNWSTVAKIAARATIRRSGAVRWP